MSKLHDDLLRGVQDREYFTRIINDEFIDSNLNIQFVRIHETINIFKKGKNTLVNRTEPVGEDGMGLFYYLINNDTGKKIPFVIWFNHQPSYLKIPSEFRNRESDFIRRLILKGFYGIIIDKAKETFSKPISFSLIEKKWKWSKSDSTGNKNKLTFHINMSQIACRKLNEVTILETSIINQLKSLV